VDFGEVVVPVDGLGVKIEHAIFGGLHRHRQPQPLQVHVIEASWPPGKERKSEIMSSTTRDVWPWCNLLNQA